MDRRFGRRSLAAAVLPLVLVLVLVGCGEEPDTSTRFTFGQAGSVDATQEHRSDVSPELAARLDSGNAAYMSGEIERALEHYRAAVREDPHEAAAWFGVFMAETALGNTEAADYARRQAELLGASSPADHPPSTRDHPPSTREPDPGGY